MTRLFFIAPLLLTILSRPVSCKDGRLPDKLIVVTEKNAVAKALAILSRLLFQDFWSAQIEMASSNAVSSRKLSDNNHSLQAALTMAGRAGAGSKGL
jgi:hypothetical protein